jgi:hypothetical protein
MTRALLALLAALPAAPLAADPAPDFDRDVAPLLVRRCLDCHSGAKPKGSLDLSRRDGARAALDGGSAEKTLLWQRVRDEEMPPKKPLSASEKSLLKRWLDAGARWGADPIDPFRATTAHRAGYDWWSLLPVRASEPPAVKHRAWPRNPIDRFVLAKLEARGLSPSPEADRRTLIRRVTFDLIGLPPTPDEVAAFLADTRLDAYERLVERLLASPAYGERYARHWLDVVRFGESDGFERDLPRFSAWPYRDWVVRALNADVPYDEFVRLQLAGDALRPDALAATGFLVAGPHDIVVPVGEAMRAAIRQDELEDLIGTMGQTFLGLTVHCARCHDHKFDPVSQKDYYRLAAALGGVRHGERTMASEATQVRLVEAKKRAEKLRREMAAIEEPARRQVMAEKVKAGVAGPEPLAVWDFVAGLADQKGSLDGRLHGGAKLTGEGLVVDGRDGYVATAPLRKDLREKTLEAWVRLDGPDQRGGGVMSVQTTDGRSFDAIVYGEQQPRRWMAGSEFFSRTKAFGGPGENKTKRTVHLVITYSSGGLITAYRDGVPYGQAYRADVGPATFLAGQAQVVFGLRHGAPGGDRMLKGIIQKARLYERALTAAEVAASAGVPTIRTEEVVARLAGPTAEGHRRLREQLRTCEAEVERLGREVARRIYAVNSQPVGPTYVLHRGSVTSPGERVEPAVLVALNERLGVSKVSPRGAESARRVELARWITDPRNPLFARVAVNRLWQHHFGVGLVDTPSDLGFNGGRPSHPELLDWLAHEFVAGGLRVKALHRLIVTSAAYRQSSRPRPEALKIDADNRLLWRKSPARLEAEAVRDAMLAVTGELERTLGGPPYLDFRTYFFKGTQFYDALPEVGPAFARRSLYRMWARGGRSPFLDTFDCPDPSATAPRRAVTTTPLQALALLNNAFVLHQAEALARRVRAETGGDVERQVRRAYELVFGREVGKRELELVRRFIAEHGLEALARVLFNTNEFVQVE